MCKSCKGNCKCNGSCGENCTCHNKKTEKKDTKIVVLKKKEAAKE